MARCLWAGGGQGAEKAFRGLGGSAVANPQGESIGPPSRPSAPSTVPAGLGREHFLAWAAWTCVLASGMILLLALLNACAYIDKFTRMAGELFGMLIAVGGWPGRGGAGRGGAGRGGAGRGGAGRGGESG